MLDTRPHNVTFIWLWKLSPPTGDSVIVNGLAVRIAPNAVTSNLNNHRHHNNNNSNDDTFSFN